MAAFKGEIKVYFENTSMLDSSYKLLPKLRIKFQTILSHDGRTGRVVCLDSKLDLVWGWDGASNALLSLLL